MKRIFLIFLSFFSLSLFAQDSLQIDVKKILVYGSFDEFEHLNKKDGIELQEGNFYITENDSFLLKKKFSNGNIVVGFPVKTDCIYNIQINGKNCLTKVKIQINTAKFKPKGIKSIGIGYLNPLKYLGLSTNTPRMIHKNNTDTKNSKIDYSSLNATFEFDYAALEHRFIESSTGIGKVAIGFKEGINNIFTSKDEPEVKSEKEEKESTSDLKPSAFSDTSHNKTIKNSIKNFFTFNKSDKPAKKEPRDTNVKDSKVDLSTNKFYKELKERNSDATSILELEDITNEEELDLKHQDIKKKREALKKQILSARTHEDSLRILEIEMSLESAEKTLELIKNELSNQKQISSLNKKLLNEEKERLESEKGKKRLLFGGLALSGFLFILVSYFLIKSRALNKRVKMHVKELKDINEEIISQRDKIETQKSLIEAKNMAITESINYAKRIQETILPKPEKLSRYLSHHFVMYRPKDIVAGDFYWMQKIEHNVLIAAADCTGHGVPGSLVSIVCHNALTRSVREFNLVQPNEILDKTKELVTQAFDSHDHSIKDGMDISLVSINFDQKKIFWAGANNPLYIVNKVNGKLSEDALTIPPNKYQLIQIKPDKQPIGYSKDINPYKNHELSFTEAETIYLFTDGFPDQFGGDLNKKFGYRRFRELLLEIGDKTMEKQKQIIEHKFDEWKRKGKDKQIDDVCVIGIRMG